MIKRLRYTTKVGALMTVLATGLLVAGASPALADTSTASANAATLSLNGGALATTGTCTVTHPSNSSLPPVVCAPGTASGQTTPALSLLGTQTAIQAGALVQQAVANPSPPSTSTPATSAACAGTVGPGGTIQIGAGGACTPTTPGGVVIDLGGLATIRADAILGECTATSNPQGGTTNVQLVNATIQLLGGSPVPLASNPAPNTTVLGLGPLLNVTLNKQPPANPPFPAVLPGGVATTALSVQVLSGVPLLPPLVDLSIGTVFCGPNAIAPDVPVIPLKGLPIALATVAGVGVIAMVVRRRRHAVVSEI